MVQNTKQDKDEKFLKLFDEKQEAYDELKNYVLDNRHATDLIKHKKFKDLLQRERETSNNFDRYLLRSL